jgi:uncharacterized protein (DUF1499 family)
MIEGSTRARAETSPAALDTRLRGRTYAITFDRVWNAALALAGGELPRWRVLKSDDQQGIIQAEAASAVWARPSEVRIRIGLDANGQTRVDIRSASKEGKRDFGSNARRIDRLVRALDAKLGATPAQILDATRKPRFSA